KTHFSEIGKNTPLCANEPKHQYYVNYFPSIYTGGSNYKNKGTKEAVSILY
ncbi:hypothetical protein ACJX0J_036991, partial [Zea mays]